MKHSGKMWNLNLITVLLWFGNAVAAIDIGRRHDVPVLFARGSHYDIGYDVGRTFGSLIKEITSSRIYAAFEQNYHTETGRAAYEKTLANLQKRYPFYLKEIQGVADGSKVPFYKLLLIQMDDIIETINDNNVVRNDTGGCTSIAFNNPQEAILGHTEDASLEIMNHFYILSAHVIPSQEELELGASEEHFASLCYAGNLPGYTMGYNTNGLVFSINTLSARDLKPGCTPRSFITRAILSAKNFDDAERILRDEGVGIGNGFSLNMIWTKDDGTRDLYNVEVGPDPDEDKSLINVQHFSNNQTLTHCNKYLRLKVPEVTGPIIDSSVNRHSSINTHKSPQKKADVENILSDSSGKGYRVFEDRNQDIVTIAAGIFDLNRMTWSIYIDKPNQSEPVAVLPINFLGL